MTIDKLYELYREYPSVQTDTRNLRNGDLFFALKGPNFNGNDFAEEAFDRGAAYVIVDEKQSIKNEKIILVDDVLSTLQQLALKHRQQFDIPFLAITGSNGKTTTKELIHAVLSSTFTCYTTRGNLNNHIGIPLTILNIKMDAQIAVIEMGANHQGEIASYCTYTRPTHGLITNCGKAHLEGFGGIVGVRKGKGELFDYLRETQGTAFIMSDYDYLHEMSQGINKIISYGSSGADIEGRLMESEPYLSVELPQLSTKINTRLVGTYNLPNVLAAVAIGKHFGVHENEISAAIENYEPSNSRSQLVKIYSNYIILDAYNANPSSMKAAIENFASVKADKKVLMLGAMAELGEESFAEHQSIIDLIKQHQWSDVVLVGGDFLKTEHPFTTFNNSLEARDWFDQQNFENTHFLIKGSRSMRMEKVVKEVAE